jgi:hypothetical protein
MNKLNREITTQQVKLVEKVKKSGLYENFGQTEVRKLEDKFIDISDYTDEMNTNRFLIESFNGWCVNYCG